jgi:hypothetical protein
MKKIAAMKTATGLRAAAVCAGVRRAVRTRAARKRVMSAIPVGVAAKIRRLKTITAQILTRGSSRWRTVSPGRYSPRLIMMPS